MLRIALLVYALSKQQQQKSSKFRIVIEFIMDGAIPPPIAHPLDASAKGAFRPIRVPIPLPELQTVSAREKI